MLKTLLAVNITHFAHLIYLHEIQIVTWDFGSWGRAFDFVMFFLIGSLLAR